MLKLFSDNLKIISGLNICSSNDMGFFYLEPMVFSNKRVASEVTERISRNQLAVRCRNFCCPLKSFFLFLSGAKRETPTMLYEGKFEHTGNLAECPGVQRIKYVLTFW